MKHTDLTPMARAYLVCALWTTDDDAPGGQDYDECGRADELLPHIEETALAAAQEDCEIFEFANLADINASGLDSEQVGHALWLSRNGHGSGFFDRKTHNDPQSEQDACDRLQDAARAMGEKYCEIVPVVYID